MDTIKELFNAIQDIKNYNERFNSTKVVFESLIIKNDDLGVLANYCDKEENNSHPYEIIKLLYEKYPSFFEVCQSELHDKYVKINDSIFALARINEKFITDEEYELMKLAINNGFLIVMREEENLQKSVLHLKKTLQSGKAEISDTLVVAKEEIKELSGIFINSIIDTMEVDRDEFQKQMTDSKNRYDEFLNSSSEYTKKMINTSSKKLIRVLEKIAEKTEK